MAEDIHSYSNKKSDNDEYIEENHISLECPNCSKENKVKLSSKLKCKKCKKTLSGFNYKSFILPSIAVIGLSGISGAIIDDTVNLNRASVKTEYKMMKTCIDEHMSDYLSYRDVRDNCFCAIESMSGLLDAQKARFYGRTKLEKLLKEKYRDCAD